MLSFDHRIFQLLNAQVRGVRGLLQKSKLEPGEVKVGRLAAKVGLNMRGSTQLVGIDKRGACEFFPRSTDPEPKRHVVSLCEPSIVAEETCNGAPNLNLSAQLVWNLAFVKLNLKVERRRFPVVKP